MSDDFSKDFPSLKDKQHMGSFGSVFIDRENVIGLCLDKQRVKEAIEKEKQHISSHVRECAERIEKGLGL